MVSLGFGRSLFEVLDFVPLEVPLTMPGGGGELKL